MFLMIAGGVLATVGAAGAAGSGLKLDPEQARKDLEPWARLGGGLTKDSLDEMGIDVPKIAGGITGTGGRPAGRARSNSVCAASTPSTKTASFRRKNTSREKQELLDRK